MSSHCNLRLVRAWVPRATLGMAFLVVVIFMLGVGYLLTYFFESIPYFSTDIPKTEVNRENLNPEKEKKIKEALDSRRVEREKLMQGVIIDPEGKNPFNWP